MQIAKHTARFAGNLFLLAAGCSPRNPQAGNKGFFSLDENTDGRVDGNEFSYVFEENDFYEIWDLNQNGLLDEKEWSEGVATYYSSRDFAGDFRVWDLNNDSFVDFEEYTETTLSILDENSDEYIDEEEYTAWEYGSDNEK